MSNKTKKRLIIVLSVILLLVVGSYVGINLYLDSLLDKMDTETAEPISTARAEISIEVIEKVKERNVVNIALFGADNDGVGYYSTEDRSDAMKIVSLDYDNKQIKITSVERDVVAYFPGSYQGYGHYNWAYWYGGPTLAVQTLNYNLDLDITRYVTFSFDALKRLVDLVGGIDVRLSGAEYSVLSGYAMTYQGDNVYTLYGNAALAYCRIRKLDSDFSRMDRQNNAIKAVVSKLKDQSIPDLMNIVSELMPYISTNLTKQEIKSYLVNLLTFDLSDIQTYKAPEGEYNDICSCPGLGGYLVRSYSGMVKQVHAFIYDDDNYEPSQTVMENEERTYNTYGPFTK